MKIVVIHGSQRKGNTEKTIEIVKGKLNSLGNNDYFDFYLPKDLPAFCCGCFKCLDAGTKNAIKPIGRSLRYWGIPKIYKCGLTLWAKNWSEMPLKKQGKYEKCLGEKTYAFYNSMKNKRVYTPLKTKILFTIFRNLMNGYSDGHQDKEYWRDKGWLQGKRPW